MNRSALKLTVSAAIALCLTACGGGTGGGGSLASVPSPPQPPPPPPPITKTNFGATSDTTFVTAGEEVQFRWVESAKAYEIQFPGQQWERLALDDSFPNFETHFPQSGAYFISLTKTLDYKYTNLATQHENAFGHLIGEFAYGIPTGAGDVPITGSASYTAMLFGNVGYEISGDAKLSFNFGSGTLAGSMHPMISDAWFTYDLGQYDFTQTVYSTGSTTFSGKFIVPGGGSTADSGFSGQFTGPQGAELMAAFHAPYIDPWSLQWSNMTGLWIGKKD